jgi:uncharacterized protein (TIGR04255 family)
MSERENLPKYQNPPVVEVVCGILFKPLDKLLAPHLGMLWEKFKADYPHCQEVPPLEPVIERFGERPLPEVRFTEIPPLPRVWFIHADDTGVIQVQRDRFLHNWRKRQPKEQYPRYERVMELFHDRFAKFQSFVVEAQLGLLEPLQYELTYINHIPLGEGWTNLSEIGSVFPDFTWRGGTNRFLPAPEALNWRTIFVFPGQAGRLYSTVRHAVRRDDSRPILIFELLARGIGEDRSLLAMESWFHLAHEWIVRGFTDLTGENMQGPLWRRLR